MPRSPLTEKFLRIITLRDEVKSWPQDEQDFFLDMLVPQPASKPQKKSSKKSAGGGGGRSSKSPRATGMAAQLNKQLGNRAQSPTQPPAAGTTDDDGCFAFTDDVRCGASADANVHHLTTHPYYHEFHQPASTTAASGGGG